MDDRDLKGEAPIFDLRRERLAIGEQTPIARSEIMDAAQKLWRSAGGAELFGCCARRGECIERDVDAIEVAKILSAILQVIVDLQRGAKRIVRRPSGAAFAVNIEHKAPDRHGGKRAVVDQIF